MSQALQRLNNEIFIIEGYVYSYDSPEYEFVKSMKFDGYGEKDELSCFLFNMKVKDPIYDKKDELYPLVRYVGKTIKENGFKSNFVGVLYDSTDKKLISLPKYTYRLLKLESKEKQQVSEKYWEDLKFLMERYSEQLESRDPLFCACNDAEHSEWGFAKRFLEWYDENGQYTQRRKEESKKKGRTSWSKTVNRIVPDYIQDNIIYPKTIKEIYTNSYDDITDLQMSILNYLYNEKGYYEKNSFISDNPAFTHFEVGDTCIDIKELIEDEELCVQWIDKITFMKQMNFRDDYDALFDLLIKFLKQDFTSSNGDGLYGIFKFDNLFEVVLSDFFGNQLEIQKYNKYISVQLNSSLMTNKIIPDVNNAYYDCVEYEFVQGKENTYEIKKYDRKTNEHILIPDIVFEFQKDSINYVFIIDAKYYDYHFVEQDDVCIVENMPQNYDVIKQYYYEQMLESIYAKNNVDIKIVNLFVLPWQVHFDWKKGKTLESYKEQRWSYVENATLNGNKIYAFISYFDTIVNDIRAERTNKEEARKQFVEKVLKSISLP